MPKRVPIQAAKKVGEEQGLSQVILLGWDGERTHVVTWGRTVVDCSQAADVGNRIKDLLGWPKDLRAEPSRVKKLQEEIKRLKARVAELEAT